MTPRAILVVQGNETAARALKYGAYVRPLGVDLLVNFDQFAEVAAKAFDEPPVQPHSSVIPRLKFEIPFEETAAKALEAHVRSLPEEPLFGLFEGPTERKFAKAFEVLAEQNLGPQMSLEIPKEEKVVPEQSACVPLPHDVASDMKDVFERVDERVAVKAADHPDLRGSCRIRSCQAVEIAACDLAEKVRSNA